MSHEDHKTRAKPASQNQVSKRKKGDPEDGIRLGTLRWWALSIEKASMETLTTKPDQKTFLAIRKILAKAVNDIHKLVEAERRTRSAAPQVMSEGAACDADQDCNDPNMECCDGICVPKNACNIA